MIRLPQDCIKSITFGCRSDKYFIENVTKKIKETNNEIKVFCSFVDKYEYKVCFREQ